MVPMIDQPVRPVPPGGYAQKFGDPGAKNATEIKLSSLEEPGYELVFTAMGISNENRLRGLLEDALANFDTEAGQAGYVHPVILITPGHYFHPKQSREIFHFDYTIVDWMMEDGKLWSKRNSGPKAGWAAPAEAAPWGSETA
jgi:hypothetical protein